MYTCTEILSCIHVQQEYADLVSSGNDNLSDTLTQ